MPPTLVVDNAPPQPAQSYADYPPTLAEARAEKEGAMALSPRDLLLRLLREIDSGNALWDRLVVIAQSEGEDTGRQGIDLYLAHLNSDTALGLIARAQFNLLNATSLPVAEMEPFDG